MNDEGWIKVKDRLPTNLEIKGFNVKVRTGNTKSKPVETIINGKKMGKGFKFFTGHFQTVIAWQPIEE